MIPTAEPEAVAVMAVDIATAARYILLRHRGYLAEVHNFAAGEKALALQHYPSQDRRTCIGRHWTPAFVTVVGIVIDAAVQVVPHPPSPQKRLAGAQHQ